MNENNINIPTDIFIAEPDDAYHAKRKDYLSSHQLIDFIRCPYLYQQKKLGFIIDKETDAYMVGKAAHVRILEGMEVFQSRYGLDWPCDVEGQPLDGRTKVVKEWKTRQLLYPLHPKDSAAIEQMANGVAMNPVAIELISRGISEAVLRSDYGGFASQIRIDWLHPHRGIVDLKTCDDLTYFESDARRYKYPHQLAFYQAVLKEVIDLYVPVYLIAVEKKQPFRCGVWHLSEDCLTTARRDNEAAMDALNTCRAENRWPTGYEQLRVLEAF